MPKIPVDRLQRLGVSLPTSIVDALAQAQYALRVRRRRVSVSALIEISIRAFLERDVEGMEDEVDRFEAGLRRDTPKRLL